MNIYSCIDNKNIDKIIVLFYSCYVNSSQKDKLKFYLLVENEFDYLNLKIPDVLKDILFVKDLDYYELEKSGWINIISDFNKYFYIQGSKCKHIMNFARFFIFKFFPEINRAIYLDWDMIVEDDIHKLSMDYNSEKLIVAEPSRGIFNTLCGNIGNLNEEEIVFLKLKNNHVFRNQIQKIKALTYKKNILIKYNKLIKEITNIDNASNSKSFNAGFYIISKDKFDENNLQTLILKLIKIQKDTKPFRFGTQVIMNLISLDNIIFIDNKWNNTPSENNSISHWQGLDKPWETKDPKWMKYYNELKKSNQYNINEFISNT